MPGPFEVNWHLIQSGRTVFWEFLHASSLWDCDCGATGVEVDYHNVADTLSHDQRAWLGTKLEHLPDMFVVLTSFGWGHADDIVEQWNKDPLTASLDGGLFCKYRENYHRYVSFDRPRGWPLQCIRARGDKSTLSSILGTPTMLIDDREGNADVHATGHQFNKAVICKRGRNELHPMIDGYLYEPNPAYWPRLAVHFEHEAQVAMLADVGRAVAL